MLLFLVSKNSNYFLLKLHQTNIARITKISLVIKLEGKFFVGCEEIFCKSYQKLYINIAGQVRATLSHYNCSASDDQSKLEDI